MAHVARSQTEHIDAYLKAGNPVVAMRTATHGFAPPPDIHDDVLGYLREEAAAARAGEAAPPVVIGNSICEWSAAELGREGRH